LQTTITASCTDQSYESVNTTILGSRTVSDNFTDSEFFEVIVYDSNQLSNRNAIEANLSSKYGIALS
jgi:K+-transporting ATPase c subunit